MTIKIQNTIVMDNSCNLTNINIATFTGTSHIKIPSGTTAQRPVSASLSMIRYNTSNNHFEGYFNTGWNSISNSDELVGMIAFFASTSINPGWIKANGASINRVTYADLFAKIGTTFGSVDSVTFNVPDLRGEFIRGWDDARGVDTGRVFGSWQNEAFKLHNHTMNSYATAALPVGGTVPIYTTSGTIASGGTGDTETRPRNIALIACIKY